MQLNQGAARLRGLAGDVVDAVAQRLLARAGNLGFVAVARGQLAQLLEDLMCDIGLFAAQIDGLRVVRTKAAGDLLLTLGDRR